MIAGIVIAAIIHYESQKPKKSSLTPQQKDQLSILPENMRQTSSQKAKKYPRAIELVSPSGYLNTDKITIKELVGKKVLLVDFWTYSCINCQRTQPYLNAWYKKYKDLGLEIIGVHTPEFEFEKNKTNVQKAIANFGIKYPVVQDNDYATWNAYDNRYWPRKYLIDIDGFIVYDHIGEGDYEETEQKIQELLEERMAAFSEQKDIVKDTVKPQNTESIEARSPETYFGAARNNNFGNGTPGVLGPQHLTLPKQIQKNLFYLSGEWIFEKEYATNQVDGAKIVFQYDAKNVYIVASSTNGTQIRILQDGKEVKTLEIKDEKLYQLIGSDKSGVHTLEIQITKGAIKAYTFTFG